ncbi:MAG: EamA family transporter [Leptolyngbyaceae cyanobacterium]
MPIWTLSAVSSFVCYGLWTITSKLTTQYIDPTVALMYVIIGNTITFLVLVLLTDVPWSFYPQGVGLGILTGILQHFAFFFYLVALSKGPLSWVSVMVGLYPALSVLFGTLVLQEALTLKQGVGVGLAIAAVVLIAS